ncbi:hypothetical protein RD792_014854 [Penstemon davidsonii]|uniref:Uncharacterized protein n=1 Tax=Penstemon davidsonii TaxID=160366 RepID=A0ABR0CR60_9LAMI|nr:hypothetical protein RD792_014854 [Penstemon davidsonii]
MESISNSMIRLGSAHCSCGLRVRIYTSWTKENPGRRFARCQCLTAENTRLIRDRDELSTQMQIVVNSLQNIEAENMALRRKQKLAMICAVIVFLWYICCAKLSIMPITRRMRAAELKLSDDWTFEQTARFVNLLYQECKRGDPMDFEFLTGVCQRISSQMSVMYDMRFSLSGIKKKLENMRKMNETFNAFLETPGVAYEAWSCESHVNIDYWRIIPAAEESAWFMHFRLHGEPFHCKLSYIFDTKGVGTFPRDLTGSPGWPIHVRDSDDDELAVVPIATLGYVPAVPFDEGNEVVMAENDGAQVGPSSVGEVGSSDGCDDGGMFGKKLWVVDEDY